MKILITGHKGFIGSYLYNHLKYGLGYGECVEGLDFPDDIVDFKAPSGGMFSPHYDVIIHLAAFAALRDSIENPDKFWENNVEKTKPIFDYCRENNVRLLYASSAGVYGWWQNPYAITKKVNESMAPPNSVGMRFFNVWAEQESRPDMLYRMLQENTAKYITKHKRDYIHVKDVVSAICYLISYPSFTGTVDVGMGESIPVMDIAKAMERDLPVKEVVGEPDSLCSDTRELCKLGWSPTINIKDTLQQLNDRRITS
jgi:nucleoside-diphosphate-sugar epimerase